MSYSISKPNSVAELLLIRDEEPDNVILSGGTDIILKIQRGVVKPSCLVSLRKVTDLQPAIDEADAEVRISAVTPLDQIARSEMISRFFPALSMAAGWVGSQQIRNLATIGGNICNASPAADTLAPLLAFEATLILRSVGGSRAVAIGDFFIGPGKTLMRSNEILETIILKKMESVSRFYKLARRKAVDLAIVGAAVAKVDGNNIRIAISAAGPKAYRAEAAEEYIKNNPWNDETIEMAAALTRSMSRPITDTRASAHYREEMVHNVTRKLLKEL